MGVSFGDKRIVLASCAGWFAFGLVGFVSLVWSGVSWWAFVLIISGLGTRGLVSFALDYFSITVPELVRVSCEVGWCCSVTFPDFGTGGLGWGCARISPTLAVPIVSDCVFGEGFQ